MHLDPKSPEGKGQEVEVKDKGFTLVLSDPILGLQGFRNSLGVRSRDQLFLQEVQGFLSGKGLAQEKISIP